MCSPEDEVVSVHRKDGFTDTPCSSCVVARCEHIIIKDTLLNTHVAQSAVTARCAHGNINKAEEGMGTHTHTHILSTFKVNTHTLIPQY